MRTTGIFKVHNYEIFFDHYNEPVYLIPVGDIHRSAPLCDEEKWVEFLDWARGKKRCYFLGMGDYDDLMSTSEREIFAHKKIHSSTKETLEETYDRYTQRLAKEMSFMKGRMVGLIEGNHYSTFSDETTTTQRLCQYLQCSYLGVTCFIILTLRYKKAPTHSHRIVIWAHHGLGAGRTVGGSINKVEQMEKNAEADIYLMGHDHRKSVSFLNKLHLKDNSNPHLYVSQKKILLARTGSFLRGYVDKRASYIADAGMSPTDLGVIKIELTPRIKRWSDSGQRKEERYVDIHASI